MRNAVYRLSAYPLLFRNAVRERLAYRAGIWLQILSGVFTILIQGSLWTALVQTGYADTSIKDMMSFVIINALAANLMRFNTSRMLGGRVRDGSIGLDITLPIRFKPKLFCEIFGGNVSDMLFAGVPGVALAVFIYGAAVPHSFAALSLFGLTLLLGIALSFQIQYLFSLSAFWIINPWYIGFLTYGCNKLFGGAVIPLWFYPDWLSAVSNALPFRFCAYEPIQIYLGRLSIERAWQCAGMQLLWLGALCVLERYVWGRAMHKVLVQGG